MVLQALPAIYSSVLNSKLPSAAKGILTGAGSLGLSKLFGGDDDIELEDIRSEEQKR